MLPILSIAVVLIFTKPTSSFGSSSISTSPYKVLIHWRHGKAGGHDLISNQMRQEELSCVYKSNGLRRGNLIFENAIEGRDEASEALQWISNEQSCEAIATAAQKSVCVRSAYEVWAVGNSYEDCANETKKYFFSNSKVSPLKHLSWCARVRRFNSDRYGGSLRSPAHQEEHRILGIFSDSLLELKGSVDLSNAEITFHIISGRFIDGDAQFNTIFARKISSGFKVSHWALNHRKYLSTTTMDNEMGFIMANIAGVSEKTAVLDPYAGSGGLLFSAAALGARTTVGIEIDKKIRYRHVNSNHIHFNVNKLTSLVHGDSSSHETQQLALKFNDDEPFDVILSDPPYGKRENDYNSSSYQMTSMNSMVSLIKMCTENRLLTVGGKLVFFVPTHSSCYDVIPLLCTHSAMKLDTVIKQCLSTAITRWLVMYTKVRDSVDGECISWAVTSDDFGYIGYRRNL